MILSNVSRHFPRFFAIPAFVALLAFSVALPLQAESSNHIVSNRALQQRVQTQSATRQQNIQTVTRFFSTPLAQRAMRTEHINHSQVKKAIPTLSDSELASLSSQANQAQQQFSAGELSTNQMLLLIVVLLIVVILVAVH